MTVEDRHPHTGRIHKNVGVPQNLLRFPNHLHFFAGIAVVLKIVDVGYRIKCNLLWIYRWLWRFSVQ